MKAVSALAFACSFCFGLRVALLSLRAGPKGAPLRPAPPALFRLATAVGICGVRGVCVEWRYFGGRHGLSFSLLYGDARVRKHCALWHGFLGQRMLWQQRLAVRRHESAEANAAVHWAQRHQLTARPRRRMCARSVSASGCSKGFVVSCPGLFCSVGRGNRGQRADGSDGVLLRNGCAGWQKRIRG